MAGCGLIPQAGADSSFSYQVRVIDGGADRFIGRAKVTLEVQDLAPLNVLSDNNGLARIMVDESYAGKPGRLIVEAAGFELYVQNIDLSLLVLPTEVVLQAAQAGAPTSAADAPPPAQVPTAVPTTVPVVITTVKQGKFSLRFDVLDVEGAKVDSSNWLPESAKTPFTPKADGEYTIRVYSDGGFGDYTLILSPQ